MTALGARKAILKKMQMMNSRSRMEFRCPAAACSATATSS